MNPELERTFRLYDFVLTKLVTAGLIEKYAASEKGFAIEWTNPTGKEFQQKFEGCIKQLGFEPNADELSVVAGIVSGFERLES